MKKVEGLLTATESVELMLNPKLGAKFSEVSKDAVALACLEWKNVRFQYNGRSYKAVVNDILATVQAVGVLSCEGLGYGQDQADRKPTPPGDE
jgi:hypothetical protein